MRILEELQITLANQEIIQLLRGARANNKKTINQRSPPQSLLDDIEHLKERAMELIQPRAIYASFASEDLTPRHLFEQSERTVLAVCTVSLSIEEECSRLMEKGELTRGVILDAIASQAAEETANETNQIILEEMNGLLPGLEHTSRFSPGYCRWLLAEGQKMIFDLLPANKIGVKLTGSMMMVPRKSISFAINFGREVEKELGERECETCNRLNCEFRRR